MKTSPKALHAADLFCGSGGTSTGLMQAADGLGLSVNLVAVNHWQTAIETHTANHPGVTHYCEDLETVNPRHAVPGGHLHLLVASPECIHHSNARGGRPMNDQSRSSAWHILRWAEALYIENILIENVKEFQNWGALMENGRPDPKLKGRLYRQFLASLRALGYTVSERIVNAADYGDATTRQRLFIQARRGGKRPVWPVQTHIKPAASTSLPGLMDGLPTWKPARDIIDWTVPGKSIYERKKPLAPATMARIFAGLRKYSGLPFFVPSLSEREGQNPRTHDVDAPLPTVTSFGGGNLVQPVVVPFLVGAGGPSGAGEPQGIDDPLGVVLTENHRALVEPFIVEPFIIGQQSGAAPRLTDEPLPTIATAGAISLTQPFLVIFRDNQGARSLDRPTPTITTDGGFGLAEPFLVVNRTHSDARGVDTPIPTLTTGGNMGLCEPVIIPTTHSGGESRAHDIDAPLPTVTTAHRGELALAEPFLMVMEHSSEGHDRRVHPLERPLTTVTGSGDFGLCQPYLTEFHGGSGSAERTRFVEEPVCTLDTSNRVGLAEPFLVSYYGQGEALSVDEPLDTVTARDRFALVDPQLVTDGLIDKGTVIGWLDIRFRMLQPHELAAAMSFPPEYHFAGNREAQVKQIGNSVAVGVAKALCTEILRGLAL